jgi:hypothetical protein
VSCQGLLSLVEKILISLSLDARWLPHVLAFGRADKMAGITRPVAKIIPAVFLFRHVIQLDAIWVLGCETTQL